MKILFPLALFSVVGLLSSCTSSSSSYSGSTSSGTGTPTYTAPSTMEVQSQLEQTHHDRTRIY